MSLSIIGQRSATKQRIEKETNTKIIIRQNEQGEIVIRGQKRKEIAMSDRFANNATHFLCFAMNTPPVMDKVKEFKAKVVKECGSKVRGLDKGIFVKPETLHVTLCALFLIDEEELNTAKEILTDLLTEFRSEFNTKDLKVELKGIGVMDNDPPTDAHILYANCKGVGGVYYNVPSISPDPYFMGNEATIQTIANRIAGRFVDEGFSEALYGPRVKLHCTLINTQKRAKSKGSNGNRESFDARPILSKFKDFDFGTVDIKEVKFATRAKGPGGFYKCTGSFCL